LRSLGAARSNGDVAGTSGRALGVAFQLAMLVTTVALHLHVLAVFACLVFLWQGSTLVYELLSHQTVPSATLWMTLKLSELGTSDGTWAVAAGLGAVVIVTGWLIALTYLGSGAHYVGVALSGATAWVLGTMRRARHQAVTVDDDQRS
jgi:hypothetical protein